MERRRRDTTLTVVLRDRLHARKQPDTRDGNSQGTCDAAAPKAETEDKDRDTVDGADGREFRWTFLPRRCHTGGRFLSPAQEYGVPRSSLGLNCMHTGTLVRPRFGVRFSEGSPVSGVASRAAPRRVCRGANRKVSGVSCESNGTHSNFWWCRNYGKEGPGRGVGHPSAGRGRALDLEDSSKKSPRSAHASGIYTAPLDTSKSALNSTLSGCRWSISSASRGK